jgi:hypothetical protein
MDNDNLNYGSLKKMNRKLLSFINKFYLNFKNLKLIINECIKDLFLRFNLILNKLNKNQKKQIDHFLKKIKIIDSGYKLIRIGGNNDGGYLIPNILNQIEFCFSPGVGSTSSFEDHLLNFNIKSYLADGTVDYIGKHDFIKKNLSSYNDENNITLESWINEKIKNQSNNLLLQMDIEGSEIETLYKINIATLDRFKCIIIEFHNFLSILNFFGLKIYSDIFNKILKTHYIVHIHPNNNCHNLKIIKNNIPDTLEITFINKKIVKYVQSINFNLPHSLDQKNVPNLRDIKCPEIFYR